MATAVASRFAVLCDDVDDDYSTRKRRPQPKKPEVAKSQPAAQSKVTNNKKKKNKENTQVQSSKPKTKTESSGAVKKKKEPAPEQWEQWKEKDEQIVNVSYKEDLTQAILLSKLDYEEKKDFYEQAKTAEPKPPEPVERRPGGKKNKKTIKVLSVEEFHSLGKDKSREDSPSVTVAEPLKDPEFFSRLQAEVKKELTKENSPPAKAPKVREPFDEEALTLAKLRDAFDKKVQEAEELKEEHKTLKEELKSVKTRNRQLCHILAHGEMKDKAEVLVELERLQSVRDELSAQVATLHVQLEQERSKVRALSNESKTKDKNKKRTTSSGEQ